MKRPFLALLALAALGLTACDEAALGGGTGGGGAAPSAPAATDQGFTRDAKGCLYQKIGGTLVPIVDANGRQRCDVLG